MSHRQCITIRHTTTTFRITQVERYVIRGGKEGYERLRLLARDRWPDTAALFERAGLSPGMRCIDLGCGGGEVTFEIARLVAPGGSVTGVDMDAIKLDLARRAAGMSVTGVSPAPTTPCTAGSCFST